MSKDNKDNTSYNNAITSISTDTSSITLPYTIDTTAPTIMTGTSGLSMGTMYGTTIIDDKLVVSNVAGERVEFYFENGLLKVKGDYSEEIKEVFLTMLNKSIVESADINLALEELLLECLEVIKTSSLKRTKKGKKLLSKIKEYCLGD